MTISFINPRNCICHKTNIEKVRIYADLMARGADFPPIKVIHRDGLYYVIDGNHRVQAAILADQSILADIVNFLDASDAEKYFIGRRWSIDVKNFNPGNSTSNN